MQYDISDSELALELSPEVLTSTLRVWRTLHTEGMCTYHIQRIHHLEPADICSWLELCRWINSNPHTIRNISFNDSHTR
jgi:vesicle coat complex subunit